ncbi:MAG TPA: methyltransferase domain-containing protein [Methanocella sp.]|nr:methyltransferase domain-containing protein [Methanocella sp.]
MTDIRAKMFNRRASGAQFKPDDVVRSLSLSPGQTVADIGSGGGYYSFRFAQIVGKSGRVYAVDTNQGLLDYVRRQGAEKGLSRLETVLTDGFPSAIPEESLDLVFVRNVYHHLPDPAGYFAEMKKRLRPKGRAVIIDYSEKSGGISFRSLFDHTVSAEKVQQDMARAGYRLEHSYNFISEQYYLVFSPLSTG